MRSVGLPERLVEDLAWSAAYPDDPTAGEGVETIQTHLSHLFLTPQRVVKLRKAVRLPFVDFSMRARRVADCHNEVALNRRLAPDVYLGVARVEERAGHFEVREQWEPELGHCHELECERVVVMRRLESGRDALSLLENGVLQASHLDAVAATLARFHARVGLGCPAPWTTDGWREHCLRPIQANLDSLGETSLDDATVDAVRELCATTRERVDTMRDVLEVRRLEGRAVEGHGDVHLQHIWFERHAPEPVLIDCVEFDPALRRIDSASEVAFLAMDLAYRGREELAAHFLRRYAAEVDDFGLFGVIDLYQSYRAAVRGKVAALAAVDPAVGPDQRKAARASAQRHVELALQMIQERPKGALVLVCGTVGVGKSTVAEALAERTGGAVISSDWTRKHMDGLCPDEHRAAETDRGIYSADKKDAVYSALLARSEAVVDSGRLAILDATFDRRVRRDRVRVWAAERGIDAALMRVDCDEALTRERLERRASKGTDASDAGPELLSVSRARFESPTEWPARDLYEVHTDCEADTRALDDLAGRFGAPWR